LIIRFILSILVYDAVRCTKLATRPLSSTR